jgi:glutamate--cysteine ligase
LHEAGDGPVIAIEKPGTSLTLEPGAQFELSAGATDDLHEVELALTEHERELVEVGEATGIVWLPIGFHPLAKQAELPWVPKRRYPVMRRYLPTRGTGALDMMLRTATVQANFDFADERDALDKLVVCLRMAPLVNAWLAYSPYVEGKFCGMLSARGETWLRMEPERSGLIRALWDNEAASYADYVRWALEAPMFLIQRGDRVIENTGQTFRGFLKEGYRGERAQPRDWVLHLNTLFPEARLKSTLEVRPVDSLPKQLALAAVALFTGILYDAQALRAASALLLQLDYARVEAARKLLVTRGLDVDLGGVSGHELARELLVVAKAGLVRRARAAVGSADESAMLEPLARLLSERTTPAEQLLARLGDQPNPRELAGALALVG